MQVELQGQKAAQRTEADGKQVMKGHEDISGDDASSLC